MDKPTAEWIRNYKKDLEKYYSNLTNERNTDQEFYDDTFTVKIKEPYRTVRTGSASKMVDAISDYINTSRILVTREPHKTTQTAKESAEKVSAFLINYVEKYKEAVVESAKNAPLRGEAVYQTQYLEDDIPVELGSPDPMIILCDPQESSDGVPVRVIKTCKMTVGVIKSIYPKWGNFRNLENTKLVDYIAYWDKDWRYIEADKQPCIDLQPNILGFVSFVHCASGFGKDSPEGKPETKYVGKLGKFRGLLIEQCETRSRLDSGIALWANPFGVFRHIIENIILETKIDDINLSPGHNIEVPYGIEFKIEGGTAPPPEVFIHLREIEAKLGMEIPPVISGVPSSAGASGRQEDIYTTAFRKKPEKIQKNLERALATALGQALRILDTIPGLLPIQIVTLEYKNGEYARKEKTLTKEDIDGYYGCKVEFKPDEEIEQARNLMMYRALYESPSGALVPWKMVLTKGLGMADAEAEEAITDTLAENAMRTNPLLANIAVEEAMEKLGMEKYLSMLKQQGQPLSMSGMAPSRGGVPRTFTGGQGQESTRQMFTPEAGGVVRQPPGG